MDGLDLLAHHNPYQSYEDHRRLTGADYQRQQTEFKSQTTTEPLNNDNNSNLQDNNNSNQRLADTSSASLGNNDAQLDEIHEFTTRPSSDQAQGSKTLHQPEPSTGGGPYSHQLNESSDFQNPFSDTSAQNATSGRSGNQAGDLESGQLQMSDDDAFIAFCADSSSVLNNHPDRRYHVNKLYQPLAQNSSQQNADCEAQLVDQDDECLLYQELRFIESTTRGLSDGIGRTELTKILEDDDDDGQLADDPLDHLQLTNMIGDFDDFAPSPLIDTCNGRDLILGEIYSHHNSISPDKPDSSGRGNEQSPISNYAVHDALDGEFNQQRDEPYNMPDQQLAMIMGVENDGCYSTTRSKQDGSYLCQQQGAPQLLMRQGESQNQLCAQSYESPGQDGAYKPCERASNLLSAQAAPVLSHVPNSSEPQTGPSAASNKSKTPTSSSSTLEDSSETATSNSQKAKKRRSVAPTSRGEDKSATYDTNVTKKRQKTNEYHANHISTPISNETSAFEEDEDAGFSDNNSMTSSGSRKNQVINHYRRRTANARERIRMRELNQAFEKLKKRMPAELIQQSHDAGELSDQSVNEGAKKGRSSGQQPETIKLTKINTLRLAVSYISNLTELLNENPAVSTAGDSKNGGAPGQKRQAVGKEEDLPLKTKRRSRCSTNSDKKVPSRRSKVIKLQDKSSEAKKEHHVESAEPPSHIVQPELRGEAQPPLLVTNSLFRDTSDHQRQQQQQPTFIAIQNHQNNHHRQQLIAAYPNQQQLLISQPFNSNQDRAPFTPVAVAILGLPTATRNQSIITNDTNNPTGIQLFGIPSHQLKQQRASSIQSQPSYNLQIAQQPQNNQQQSQAQQVTLTLDDVNGLSVLRLADPEDHNNQSIQTQQLPIQLKPSNQQFVQNNQTQILSTNGRLNYAYRPIQTTQSQHSNTNSNNTILANASTNFQHATLQICNSNQSSTNLISPTCHGGNNVHLINNTMHQVREEQETCNVDAQSNLVSASNAFASTLTGINSDQLRRNYGISNPKANSVTQPHEHLHQVSVSSASRPPILVHQQQQQYPLDALKSQTFQANSNQTVTLTSAAGNNQMFREHSNSPSNTINGATIQIGQRTANVVYINPIRSNYQPAQQHHQLCLLSQNGSQQLLADPQHQQLHVAKQFLKLQHSQTRENLESVQVLAGSPPAVEKTKFINTFSAQSNSRQQKAIQTSRQENQPDDSSVGETNINQLVASLATSIRPPSEQQNSNSAPNNTQINSNCDNQTQRQQQPVRTYRFHNYDGNMITNHLYGNTTDKQQMLQQQQNYTGKRSHANRQTESRVIEQPSVNQRSRQNSLSSICSTTSSSSSSLNSSSGGSPANGHSPAGSIVINPSALPESGTKGDAHSASEQTSLLVGGVSKSSPSVATVGGK